MEGSATKPLAYFDGASFSGEGDLAERIEELREALNRKDEDVMDLCSDDGDPGNEREFPNGRDNVVMNLCSDDEGHASGKQVDDARKGTSGSEKSLKGEQEESTMSNSRPKHPSKWKLRERSRGAFRMRQSRRTSSETSKRYGNHLPSPCEALSTSVFSSYEQNQKW
ncbi:hypothetical protein CERZMDRAFT_94529 [Cercospora zeae-maydis SCOH1-5]|uniref:Uncharacterized protein n=1 Tax=Cercospora zeae-maydis SCOH1-5 TaxID=717836 RepID=A0A6A6FNT7_9PEZI|nr:hypothetical protein CERZMDRAFT_94529 [Cercospora zeae-maydis SCOH1-5]